MRHPVHPINHEVKRVRLTITEKCNLQCVYCFEKHKNYQSISLETAKQAIKNEMERDDGFNKVIVDLFGGEPFIEFQLIKELCEWSWAQDWNGKECLFWTTTNGTLIHGECQKWLYDNRLRITCGLSIDGNKEVHDRNRSESFDKIDIDFFSRTWPDRQVRAVVSEATLPFMYESIRFLHSKFKNVNIRLAFGGKWNEPGVLETLREQLEMMEQFYEDNPQIPVCSMLNIDFEPLLDKQKRGRCCGVGYNHCAYDIEGKRYPCAQFQNKRRARELSLEEIWNIDFTKRDDYLSEKCKECFLLNICQTCFGHCFSNKHHTLDDCEILYLQVKEAARIQKQRMSRFDHGKQEYATLLEELIDRYNRNNWIK